ncbi:hypothetical protein [Massilia sp. S19_KUP03_FR1]|uniref:hypothetical protein n=1 Tax=Massilia sp. S19_KUP03_FR1 TaxID=3025503 RepID=UPI002FCD8737
MARDNDTWLKAAELDLERIVAADAQARLSLLASMKMAVIGACAKRAYEAFRDQHCMDKATRSALVFARLTIENLRTDMLGARARQRAYDTAWRVMTKALAESDRIAHGAAFAELNRTASALLMLRPGPASSANLSESVKFLNRAISAYQLVGDVVRCAEVALEVLRATRAVPYSASDIPFAFYLGLVDAAGSAIEHKADSWEAMSRAWAKTEAPDGLERGYQCAEQAYQAARADHDDAGAAQAKITIGHFWLDLSSHPELIAAGVLGARFREVDPLTFMTAQFADALAHADAAHNATLAGKAAHKLSAVLVQLVFGRDERQRMDVMFDALHRTVSLFEGAERAVAACNLASALLQQFVRGWGGSDGAVRAAIAKAAQLAADFGQEEVKVACMEMAAGYQRFITPDSMRDMLSGVIHPDGHLDARFGAPEVLYFKTEQVHEATVAGGASCNIRTLLLGLDGQDREGVMAVARHGTTVEVRFSVPCARCGVAAALTMPLVVNSDDDPVSLATIRRMEEDGLPCAHCGSRNQVQFAYSAQAASFSSHPVVIYPSAWIEQKTDSAKLQLMLAAVLHAAFTGANVHAIEHTVPAEAILVMGSMTMNAILDLKVQAAMMQVASCLLTGNVTAVRAVLAAHPDAASAFLTLAPDDVNALMKDIIATIALAGTGPAAPASLATVLHAFFSTLQQKGIDAAMAPWEAHAARSTEQQESFEEAFSVAADTAQCAAYLRAFIASAPDFSHDRLEAIYEMIKMDFDIKDWRAWTKEHEAMLGKEGAQQYKDTLRAMAEDSMQSIVAAERDTGTTQAAKRLVQAALSGNGHFILLLRAFDIEVRVTRLPGNPLADPATKEAIGADTRIGWRMLEIHPENLIRSIEEHLAGRGDVVAISNMFDWFASDEVARFYVDNAEWKKLAFSLSAHANKIVFALPADLETMAQGASEELSALMRLGAQPRTVIVLDDSQKTSAEEIIHARTLLFERGFAHVISGRELDRLPGLLEAGPG